MWFPMPFRLQLDPILRLLLLNFEKDPDSVYMGFEPQALLDASGQERYLVIGWRVDGTVDVYHDPALVLDPKTYSITGDGLHALVERNWDDGFFRVGASGVAASFHFLDLDGRRVEIEIDEQNPKPRRPFGLLAPMGMAAKHPKAMPLILLNDFYFVRRRHTSFHLAIDGRKHTPDPFPLPLHGSRMLFSRYSGKGSALMFNPAQQGAIPVLSVSSAGPITADGIVYDFAVEDGKPLLKSITHPGWQAPIRLSFDPFLPSPAAQTGQSDLQGTFAVHGPAGTGQVHGSYSMRSKTGHCQMVMAGSGWIPEPKDWTTRLIFQAAKPFRHWPGTYRWTADLDGQNDAWRMDSRWQRL